MDVVRREPVVGSVDVALGPGESGGRRFLHHVAELTGDLQLALARERCRLDEQDLAADRRPRKACRDARYLGAPQRLAEVAAAAEQIGNLLRAYGQLALASAFGPLTRDLAAHGADLALEVAHAGLTRVAVDDQEQRF